MENAKQLVEVCVEFANELFDGGREKCVEFLFTPKLYVCTRFLERRFFHAFFTAHVRFFSRIFHGRVTFFSRIFHGPCTFFSRNFHASFHARFHASFHAIFHASFANFHGGYATIASASAIANELAAPSPCVGMRIKASFRGARGSLEPSWGHRSFGSSCFLAARGLKARGEMWAEKRDRRGDLFRVRGHISITLASSALK